MIKVCCATSPESHSIKDWFSDVTIIGHEDNVPPDIDLLILTGGSDIDPERYGGNKLYSYGVDKNRDKREIKILEKVLATGRTKVLGICRGMQLLSVFFGGTLVQDLGTINLDHRPIHGLDYITKCSMDWLTTVNSLHHQAVGSIGYCQKLLAVEPKTGIAESIMYMDSCLGVQYHPEMFSVELGNRFFSVITDWVMNGTDIVEKTAKKAPTLTIDAPMPTWTGETTINFQPVDVGWTVTTNNTNNITWNDDFAPEEETP